MKKELKEVDYFNFPLEKDLEEKNFFEGLKLLGLEEKDFIYGEHDGYYDFDCKVLVMLDGEIDSKQLVTFTISDIVAGDYDIDDIKKLNGYWHYSEDLDFKLNKKEY